VTTTLRLSRSGRRLAARRGGVSVSAAVRVADRAGLARRAFRLRAAR
jgi:hypothetical protein